MSEEKSRDQLVDEMMKNIQKGDQNLHLTEVAKPGVYEPVHTEDNPAK